MDISQFRTWTMQSESDPDIQYKVMCENGKFFCTCPDHQFRKNECKHIKKAKRQLAGEQQMSKLFVFCVIAFGYFMRRGKSVKKQ